MRTLILTLAAICLIMGPAPVPAANVPTANSTSLADMPTTKLLRSPLCPRWHLNRA